MMVLAGCGSNEAAAPMATETVTVTVTPQAAAGSPSASPMQGTSAEAADGEPVADEGEATPNPLDDSGKYVGHAWGTEVPLPNATVISVAAPEPYAPSDSAAVDEGFESAATVTITIRNDSDAPVDTMDYTVSATSGERPAGYATDITAGIGDPGAKVMPGKSLTYKLGLAVDEGEPVTVTVEAWDADAYTVFTER